MPSPDCLAEPFHGSVADLRIRIRRLHADAVPALRHLLSETRAYQNANRMDIRLYARILSRELFRSGISRRPDGDPVLPVHGNGLSAPLDL